MLLQVSTTVLLVVAVMLTRRGGNARPQHPAQYPAGLDPRLCPSFPQCDNQLLAEFAKNPLPIQEKLKRGELDHFYFTKPGYPVGLSPIQCPNYPFCH